MESLLIMVQIILIDTFDTLKFQGYWTRSTLNRGLFPTDGDLNQVQLQTTLPGSTLNYFRIDYKNEYLNAH